MLTICPTPIGNLDDVTPRQRRALAEADAIACEDTRRTGKLLEHLDIDRAGGSPRLVRYEEHNEREAAEQLVDMLQRGADITLVSDAGTPALSDPGYRLVRRAVEVGIEITSLPGPAAAIVALVASGLPTDAFQFRGFPPSTRSSRRDFLERIEHAELTTVLYESPHRLEELFEDMEAIYGASRRAVVGRELTKAHEEYLRGTVGELHEIIASRDRIRGECTVVIEPTPETETSDEVIDAKIRELLENGMRSRGIKEVVDELYDVSRSSLYDRIEDMRREVEGDSSET